LLDSPDWKVRASALFDLAFVPPESVPAAFGPKVIALLEQAALVGPPPGDTVPEGYGIYEIHLVDAVLEAADPAALRGLAHVGVQVNRASKRFVASHGSMSLPFLDEAWANSPGAHLGILTTWALMVGEFRDRITGAERLRLLQRIFGAVDDGVAFITATLTAPLAAAAPAVALIAEQDSLDIIQRYALEALPALETQRAALSPAALHSDLVDWHGAVCLDAVGNRATMCATLGSLLAGGPGDVAGLAQLQVVADQALSEGMLTPSEHAVLVGNAERLVELAPAPTTLMVAADTYLRAGNPNQNQGSELVLRVRPDGNNRSLFRFDQAALTAAVGSGTVTAARLELTIVENFDNWGPSGRPVDLHRLTQAWTELGATWNCGADLEPGDPTPDCPTTAWAMSGPGARPWVATPTATVTLTNGMRGVVAFDVTADVQAFLSGAANVGWLVKRTDEGPSGAVDFGARESGTPPRLVLQVQ
jgi:hypothetical protein